MANLTEANFTGAILDNTDFEQTTVSEANDRTG
jgi:uncharacterized protein YjbI with pentapeptide repeats